jgi:hypothetical protein
MLKYGAGSDLAYCNCVYDGHGAECAVLDVQPFRGMIDKGGFLIKREVFLQAGGFSGPFGVDRAEDGRFIEFLLTTGVKHTKVPIAGWIHS